MADNKQGRDEQAHDAVRRQQRRAMAEELERMHETEPPIEAEALEDIEADLEGVSFPATGAEVVAAAGDRPIATPTETCAVADPVPESEAVTVASPAVVRVRIQRPTVAAAAKRIEDATARLQGVDMGGSQREACEKTLRALKDVDADDEDGGLEVITDWIVDRIETRDTLPGSRDVRRGAAKFCRRNDYQVANDEWLGV